MVGKKIRIVPFIIALICLGIVFIMILYQKKTVQWMQSKENEIVLFSRYTSEKTYLELSKQFKELLKQKDKKGIESFLNQQPQTTISDLMENLSYKEYQLFFSLLSREQEWVLKKLIPLDQILFLPFVTAVFKTGVANLSDNTSVSFYICNLKEDLVYSNSLLKGQFLSKDDKGKNVVVIPNTIEERIFGKDQAVSKTLMISGFDYTVIGVYELKNDFEEEVLYLPSESALEEQGYTLAGAARIYLKSDQDIDRTVKQFFRAYKGEEKEWVCVDQRNGTKPFQEILDGLYFTATLCFFILLCSYLFRGITHRVKQIKKQLKIKYLTEYLSKHLTELLMDLIGIAIFGFALVFLCMELLSWQPDFLSFWIPKGRVIDFSFYHSKFLTFIENLNQMNSNYADSFLMGYRNLLPRFLKWIPLELGLLVIGTVCLSIVPKIKKKKYTNTPK